MHEGEGPGVDTSRLAPPQGERERKVEVYASPPAPVEGP